MERRDLPQARRALSRASLSWRKVGLKTALGAALTFSVLLPLNAQAAAPAACAALLEKYPDWKGKTLVNAINRSPLDERASEATYEIRLTVDTESMDAVRDLLVERLETANYPVSDVNVIERAEDVVEMVATLVSTAVDAKELDAVTADLARRPGVRHATWDVSTKD